MPPLMLVLLLIVGAVIIYAALKGVSPKDLAKQALTQNKAKK